MVKRTIGGVERDYLLLAYKGDDKLYVPSDQIDVLRQYVGGEAPTLHRLGGARLRQGQVPGPLGRARDRPGARGALPEAGQRRGLRLRAGHAVAARDGGRLPVRRDARPARGDRRRQGRHGAAVPDGPPVCGDVGFGKTEVAIRAAFKAIQDGKQVAVLAPTTLLASQHGNTFADRFAGYPIRVETLCRFLTPGPGPRVVEGSSRARSTASSAPTACSASSVRFKDLGLLVVDEEQRFGVQHKEAMKQLKTNVDVLTLTATPIPRTLEMCLVGIRDLSLLQTPPADRQPILTYVGGYDERVAVEAIRRELLREGQVFWVHNRVRSIEYAAARLRELVPEARIAVAHGQMDEGTLEQVVVDFWDGQYDVLVCTTIIESGIDMPTVNTLVVERADLLGLGQLHQLRGRVGRSGQRAYAYLFHPVDVALTEEAYERLKTIGEATELGSGFKIAMRDLEIRGAGNLLGEAQSGHIAAVGYDLYCQMVTEAVAEMKGEPIRPPAEIKLDVPTDAYLPPDYVAKEELRLEAYRRLAAVTSPAEVDDIRAEWEDRYGPLPAPAEALLTVGSLRAECHRLGLTDITISSDQARLAPIELKLSQTTRLRRLARDAIYKEDARQLVVRSRGAPSRPVPRRFLRELVPSPQGWPEGRTRRFAAVIRRRGPPCLPSRRGDASCSATVRWPSTPRRGRVDDAALTVESFFDPILDDGTRSAGGSYPSSARRRPALRRLRPGGAGRCCSTRPPPTPGGQRRGDQTPAAIRSSRQTRSSSQREVLTEELAPLVTAGRPARARTACRRRRPDGRGTSTSWRRRAPGFFACGRSSSRRMPRPTTSSPRSDGRSRLRRARRRFAR